MGILGDVYGPLNDLIKPTEGLAERIIHNKLRAMFHDVALIASQVLLASMRKVLERRV